MKWIIKLLVLTLICSISISCRNKKDEDPDEWSRGADFESLPRSGAVSFTIKDFTYVATGYGTNSTRFVDTWRFDPKRQSWDRVADFPGEARNNAVSFVLNGKGYVGLGTNSKVMFTDFYEYDPETDKWTKVSDYIGAARYGATAFTLNGTAYVGAGRDFDGQDYNDFFSFQTKSTAEGIWEKVASTPNKRSFPFVFVLGDLAYIGGGTSNNQNVNTFYSFDGTTWKEKNPLSGRDDKYEYNLTRLSPSAFVLQNTAFITGGLTGNNGAATNSTWRYVPSGDYWEEHQNFLGAARHQAVSFVHGNVAYIATGRSGTTPFYDMWNFTPNPW
ncbi:Kelch repeat-containing protein [Sphingobacterium kitahiroshimense]|uniref:Kelch repeat-containing protein n=1 Tax=Sphingobacterium kitahiroshimense TaxID=470446 RepID=A0ABV0BVP5_9SPHI